MSAELAPVSSIESALYVRHSHPSDETKPRRRARVADEALLDEFALHQESRGFKVSTIQRRRSSLTAWLAHLNGRLLTEATPDDVEDFMRRFKTQASRRHYRSDLNRFYDWACKRRGFNGNPVDFTYPPREPQREPTPLDPADVRRLIAGSTGPVRLMILLGAMAGLRVGEIGRLRREDVRADGYLVIRQGKGGKDRVVPLASTLRAELEQYGPGVIWGEVLSGHAVSQRIKRRMEVLGIVGRSHDLRHSFATEVAGKAGGDILTVQRMLGHSNPQTTMRYVRWRPGGGQYVEGLYDEEPAP